MADATALLQGYIDSYCLAATAVLILYDHAITLPQEVALIWPRKKLQLRLLFFSNRFFSFTYAVGCLMYVPFRATQGSGNDHPGLYIYAISAEFMFLIWASFAALRVFAISERDWRLATLVFLLDLIPAIIDAYNYAAYPFWPCKANCGPEYVTDILVGLMRSSVIIADLIVLIVTWIRTYRFRKIAHAVQMPLPLSDLLLRDGTIYFLLMLSVNIVNLVTFIMNVNIDIPYVVYAVSSVAVARYLLDLQGFADRHFRDGSREFTLHQPTFVQPAHVSPFSVDGSLTLDDAFYEYRYIQELESMPPDRSLTAHSLTDGTGNEGKESDIAEGSRRGVEG